MNIKSIFSAAILTASIFLLNIKAKAQEIQTNTTPAGSQVMSAYRKQIDSLDNLVIKLIGEREKVVQKVGVYKAKNHVAPLQAARFQEIVDKSVRQGQEEGLSKEFILKLLNAIHEESLKIEERLQTK